MGKIIDKLIKQSANPEGLAGNIMTKIWQVVVFVVFAVFVVVKRFF